MIPATNEHTIAGVNIPSRFSLAPLAGYSDYSFRMLGRRYGAGLVYTEMVSATALARNIKAIDKYIYSEPYEKPVALQLFGGIADDYGRAAGVRDLSAFDFIDVNMGCPVKKVFGSGGGVALLGDIEKMQRIVRSIKANTDIPVCVKIRLGIGADGMEVERALALEDAGAAFVAVHGRYRKDMFKPGTMRRDMIAKIKEALSIPVIGNGDVTNADEARSFFEDTKVDGIMIGRGAVGNPWVFQDLNSLFGETYTPPSNAEVRDVLLEHLRRTSAWFGNEEKAVRYMRKFFIRYSTRLGWGKRERIGMMQCVTEADVQAYVNGLL